MRMGFWCEVFREPGNRPYLLRPTTGGPAAQLCKPLGCDCPFQVEPEGDQGLGVGRERGYVLKDLESSRES